MSDGRQNIEGYLRGLDAYHRKIGVKGLSPILLAQGFWFEGRARSDDYDVVNAWRMQNRPRAKQCFFNAQQFCLDYREARYFEGYVLTEPGGLPIEHGWSVIPDGKVIDFTLEAMERKAKREKLTRDTSGALYLGLEIPTDFVRKVMLREQACIALAEEYFGCG